MRKERKRGRVKVEGKTREREGEEGNERVRQKERGKRVTGVGERSGVVISNVSNTLDIISLCHFISRRL